MSVFPCFHLEDMKGLSNFIEKQFLTLRKEKEVSLKIDGRSIPMTPFVRDFLTQTSERDALRPERLQNAWTH